MNKLLNQLILFFICFQVFGHFLVAQSIKPVDSTTPISFEMDYESLWASTKSEKKKIDIDIPIGMMKAAFVMQAKDFFGEAFGKANPEIKAFEVFQEGKKIGNAILSPYGFRGFLKMNNKWTAIYPANTNELFPQKHIIDSGADHHHHSCGNTHKHNVFHTPNLDNAAKALAEFQTGDLRRTYDVAIICTGEFYQANGNSNVAVNTVMAASLAGVSAIFENELSVFLRLSDSRLFNNPASDPFTPDNAGGDGRTEQAATQIANNFSASQYDIGHVFHNHQDGDDWGTGGVALLGSVCRNSNFSGGVAKGGGWSGSFNNGTQSWILLATHEFAHMFGAPHTFNGSGESCDDAISDDTAYEIGSGTTIMSYKGICADSQNIESSDDQDDYFHANSLILMTEYILNEADCANEAATGNTPPEALANPCGTTYTIPVRTPFKLRGEATDSDNDNLTYCWEQYDEDGAGSTITQGFIGNTAASNRNAPLFRSYPPASSPERVIPRMQTILNGGIDVFEVLSNVTRDINFRLTVRDNNPAGGGKSIDDLLVTVGNGGPLQITSPNGGETLNAGNDFMVTWATNGSEGFCNEVEILMSTDGGQNFDFVLGTGIPYAQQSFMASLPGGISATNQVRVMVRCIDQTCVQFFKISDNDFTISSNCTTEFSFICPTEEISAPQGDPSLDLDVEEYIGLDLFSYSISISNSSALTQAVGYNQTQTGCSPIVNQRSEFLTVKVTETGVYNFEIPFRDPNENLVIGSIFEEESFSTGNPCASFLGSSIRDAGGGSVSPVSPVSVMLDECKTYRIVFWRGTGNFVTGRITNVSGPGAVVFLKDMPSQDVLYTYLAINTQNDLVAGQSDTADFTGLGGGNYLVYGVSYDNSLDPSSFVGSSILDIQQNGDCVQISNNASSLDIMSSCAVTEIMVGAQTACDPMTNTYSQELIISYNDPPSAGSLVINGTNFGIGNSPQTVLLTGLPADGIPVNVMASFTENPSCALTQNDLFSAPQSCCPIMLDLGEDIVACEGDPVFFSVGEDGEMYEWTFEGTVFNNTDNMIEAISPGVYSVIVTHANGCTVTDEVELTRVLNPSIDAIDDFSICSGDSMTIAIITTGTLVEIYLDDNLIATDISELVVKETGLYRIVAQIGDDCVAEETFEVTFSDPAILDLGADVTICEGNSHTILAEDGFEQYEWFMDDIILPQTGRSIVVEESGTYRCRVTNEFGCSAEDEIIITVEMIPVVEFHPNQQTAFCEGFNSFLRLTDPDLSVNWYLDEVLIVENGVSTLSIDMSGIYRAEVITENDCVGTASITIESFPVVDPIDLGPDQTVCEGSEVLLDMGVVADEYQWTYNGNPISDEQSLIAIQSGSYQAFATNGEICSVFDNIVIEFVAGPTIILEENQTICDGDSYTVMAQTTGSDISWLKDGEEIEGETQANLTVTEAGVYTIVVKSTACEATEVIVINVNPRPTLELENNPSACEDETVDLSNFVVDSTGGDVIWSFDGTDLATTVITMSGNYTARIENEFMCSVEEEIFVNIGVVPTLDLTGDQSLCAGEIGQINAQSNSNDIRWFLDGQLLVGENSSNLSVSQGGVYTCTATSVQMCETSETFEVNLFDRPEVELGPDLEFCPNDETILDAGVHQSYAWSDMTTNQTITLTSPNLEEVSSEILSVTVTNENMCTSSDQIQITYLPIVTATISAESEGICEDGSLSLMGSGGQYYFWSGPVGTLSEVEGNITEVTPTETSSYMLTVSDDCPDNVAEASIEVEVFAPMEVTAGPDTCILLGQSYMMEASGGALYQWNNEVTIIGNSDIPDATVMPDETTVYAVEITDVNGCEYTDSVEVCIIENPEDIFKAISIITPNGDDLNDELVFEGLEAFPDNELIIFNRWGNVIFQKNGYQTDSRRWNGLDQGEKLPADTYYYILTYDAFTIKSTITIVYD